ncbi:MAG: alpha/beta fold hydrolase, partial [Deltaproteobacteria bacterium]|nr:alpha/beta fold hydrolase [Deltaproteobacteria bacterium]
MHLGDHRYISERYFLPRPGKAGTIHVPVLGATLACAFEDHGHKQTLLHFHGNGEIVDDYIEGFPEFMSAMQLNTFLAEYRGYGGSTGIPQLTTMLDDVDAIVEAAGGPESLIVFGRSIGSIYAIEVAHRYPQIAGLVLESGIADVLERIMLRVSSAELGATSIEIRAAFADKFDHRAKLGSFDKPMLVLHAEHDHLVDKSHAERNASWTGGPSKLVI